MKMSGRHKKRKPRPAVSPVFVLLVTLVIAAGILLFFLSGRDPLFVGISLFILALGGLLIWLRPIGGTRGADTSFDRRTGLVLEGLADAGFVALPNLQVGKRRLEYVLIGPPGVYVVRTDPRSERAARKRSGEAAVAATIRELHEDVTALGSAIKPQVEPLLISAHELEVDLPNDGQLLPVTHLERFLRTQSSGWDQAKIDEVLAAVLRAATTKAAGGDEGTEAAGSA